MKNLAILIYSAFTPSLFNTVAVGSDLRELPLELKGGFQEEWPNHTAGPGSLPVLELPIYPLTTFVWIVP
jgi:hypothetical protein